METVNDVNSCLPPPPSTCPCVSVIIAMYNEEKYIADCLDSLLAQTFANFEVIVADDCSTDKSCAIIESRREKFDGRLKLVHTEKNSGGCAVPRNVGLPFSRGEYIFFMDADDMLTETALEDMFTLVKQFDADALYFERHYDINKDLTNKKLAERHPKQTVKQPTFEPEDMHARIQGIMRGRYSLTVWDKFVRRDLLFDNKIFFPPVMPSEDDIWTFGVVFYAKKFLRVPNPVYVRRWSEGSLMRTRRTPQQIVSFWSNPILFGLKSLDDLMSRHEFFKRNPQQRYAMLEMFVSWKFGSFYQASLYLAPNVFYDTIQNKFRDRLGEFDVLIPALCAALNMQHRVNAANQEKFQKLAAQSQEQVKQFNQFAAQTKAYIARLEAEVRRLQAAQ